MEWNFRSCLNTVHEGVKAIKEEGKEGARVVLTGSVVSMMSFAGYSSYAPSKYAIRGTPFPLPLPFPVFRFSLFLTSAGLAESLRAELLLYGISVHLFLPATILSPGFDAEQRTKPDLTKRIEGPDEGMTPDQVARELIKGACCSASTLPAFPLHSFARLPPSTPTNSRPRAGLERNDFYITYEPVGHMLRTSRGTTPRNSNYLMNHFWGVAGSVRPPFFALPFSSSPLKAEDGLTETGGADCTPDLEVHEQRWGGMEGEEEAGEGEGSGGDEEVVREVVQRCLIVFFSLSLPLFSFVGQRWVRQQPKRRYKTDDKNRQALPPPPPRSLLPIPSAASTPPPQYLTRHPSSHLFVSVTTISTSSLPNIGCRALIVVVVVS